ncbi:Cytochrome c oxidase subunit 6A, mitochondrial [Ascosphaera aggregata]|nr:Cytochrome c oxidase subunit 6A, mitochondrial [Ascosphaera aggregata]
MLSNRALLRTTAHRRLITTTITNTRAAGPLQRRFASSTTPETSATKAIFPDTEFARERLQVTKHAKGTSDLWRKLTFYVVPAAVILGSINAYVLWNEHWEHWAHDTPLEERTEYPYQNIRNKNFFWGDGDKTIL